MILPAFNEESLWRVEEACCNAYPAWREVLLDGWLLRAAGGTTRRINSVNPLRGGPEDPAAIIDVAKALYARLGQDVLFRVPTLVPAMAAGLERLGFVASREVLTLAASFTRHGTGSDASISRHPNADWLEAWRACRPDLDDASVAAFRQSVSSLLVPAAFFSRFEGGQPVAVAYGALHRGFAIVEAVATHPAHRQRGHARAVLTTLGAWAEAAGAEAICLQVSADNAPARRLYTGLGFRTELYRYHYRTPPHSPPASG